MSEFQRSREREVQRSTDRPRGRERRTVSLLGRGLLRGGGGRGGGRRAVCAPMLCVASPGLVAQVVMVVMRGRRVGNGGEEDPPGRAQG